MTTRSVRLATASAVALLLALGAAPAFAESWSVDAPHTEVSFSVRHFFTPVTGTFDDFEVDLQYDEANPSASSVTATIQVASINTRNERRDNHLRSADFFHVDEHPTMTFESTSVEEVGEGELVATGDLTIKGMTREIELPITVLGVKEIPPEMQEMLGGSKKVASFEALTTIDRSDFEVGVGNWAATVVVGAEVDIHLKVEAHLR